MVCCLKFVCATSLSGLPLVQVSSDKYSVLYSITSAPAQNVLTRGVGAVESRGSAPAKTDSQTTTHALQPSICEMMAQGTLSLEGTLISRDAIKMADSSATLSNVQSTDKVDYLSLHRYPYHLCHPLL